MKIKSEDAMSGKYDAAITALLGQLIYTEIPEIRSAIRVLEAAGKVDKGSALMFMDDVDVPTGRVLDYGKVGREIRAMIDALPEEKE